MIWQLAIAAIRPRLVELRDDPRSLEEEDDPHTSEHPFGNISLQSTSPSPTPPPLQAFSNMKMQYTSSCPIPLLSTPATPHAPYLSIAGLSV
jgi:hypothetical protein